VAEIKVGVGLVHYPVVDKNGKIIAASLTPTDLHDLARSARTYGVERFWIISPLTDQQKLAGRMIGFWQMGVGADYNPNRGEALELIRVVEDLEAAVAGANRCWGEKPLVWATRAGGGGPWLGFGQARQVLNQKRPVLVIFGTAWGLAPEALNLCDAVLAPIEGRDGYNHLSVRSAAAVVLDRLLGRSLGDGE